MLWTEPSGEDVPGGTRGSTHFSLEKFDQTYSEVRRFVVLENKGTFSQCMYVSINALLDTFLTIPIRL